MSNSPRYHVTVLQYRPGLTPAIMKLAESTLYFMQAENVKDAYELVIAAGESLGITFKITKIEEAF